MKKALSLLLALLMVITAIPMLGIVAFAAGESDAAPRTTYSIYQQDFESLSTDVAKKELLHLLGWYIPDSETGNDIADYSVVTVGSGENANKVLRVSTKAPVGINTDSVVTIFDGDPMAIVRKGEFTLSYQLTYRRGTENTDGFSTIIYNYNGKGGTIAGKDAKTYGIAAIRASGTGYNGVYYPISGGSTMALIEDAPGTSWMSMGNRYTKSGEYPSLYARLFLDNAEQEGDVTLSGSDVFVDVTLNVRMEYSYSHGVSVYINNVLVSETTGSSGSKYSNAATWNDFVTHTSGTAIALLTKPGVVADIDNISVTAKNVSAAEKELPELLITEIAPSGWGNTTNGINYYWNEYIEIYNPTDHPIDLRDYSICFSNISFDGDSDAPASDSGKMTKFTQYLKLDTVIGQPVVSSTNYYHSSEELRAMCTDADLKKIERGELETLSRFRFADANTDLEKGTRYVLQGKSYKADPNGELIKIKYVERWNERYEAKNNYNDQGVAVDALYSTNTLIAPGACVLIYTILDSTELCWTAGVNAGQNNTLNISDTLSFRQSYKAKGLGDDNKIKVIAERTFNLADNSSRRYYIAKAYDDNGAEINYKERYVEDMRDVVCYADYVTPLVAGIVNGGRDATDTSTLGNAGVTEGGYSGVYVYGVDASSDYRGGTLYIGRNKVTSSNHVGRLAGYQQILFDALYKKTESPLAITEIAPRTLNLKGEDKNAFSAMEITNVSDTTVDLYQYAIVRNELGAACNYGKGFTRAVEMRKGNPVNKGKNNGAYYYFVNEHIVNPDECMLLPGESVVVWFLTHDTYANYYSDDDFGVDYFREYWNDMGNPQMALKDGEGNYAVKVIAVDGNSDSTYNSDFADKVLDLSYTSSAIYGIANATEAVLSNVITSEDVINVAYLGQISTYYDLHEEEQTVSGVTYVYQVLDYLNIPANGSMHYVYGNFSIGSGMEKSLKVLYWAWDNAKMNYYEKDQRNYEPFKLSLVTSYAMQTPDLGVVRGKEAQSNAPANFYPVKDSEGNTTYYYYNENDISVLTLGGAGLNTVGETAKLRFDNAIPVKAYHTLAATYGAENLRVGMLVVETAKAPDGTFTRETLQQGAIPFADVEGRVLYRTGDFAVLGSSIEISEADYGTSYTAIGYLEVTLKDGTTKTFWSPATSTGTVRDVAKQARNDISAAESDIYRYRISGTSQYSRYTEEERAVLYRFAK